MFSLWFLVLIIRFFLYLMNMIYKMFIGVLIWKWDFWWLLNWFSLFLDINLEFGCRKLLICVIGIVIVFVIKLFYLILWVVYKFILKLMVVLWIVMLVVIMFLISIIWRLWVLKWLLILFIFLVRLNYYILII